MEKIHRNHIDVGVAFASNAKRIAATSGSSGPQVSPLAIATPLQGLDAAMVENTLTDGLTHKLKDILRPVARMVYRASKPFLRPLAFRARRYLLDGLQGELNDQKNWLQPRLDGSREDLQNATAATLENLRAIENQLNDQKNWLQPQLDGSREDLQNATAVTLADLRAIRNELNDLKNWLQPRLDRIEQYTFASARRVAVNCGPGEVLVRSEVGYVLCSSSDHAVLTCLLEAGELERGTRLLIQSFLKPNDMFIDVGANLGLHTLAAARAMQGQGRIIAFEPFEPTQRLLAKSIWMNGFAEMTEIHQAAVSNRTGHQTLFLGATSGHHSLFPLTTPSSLAPQPVEVPLVRLDDVVPNSTKVDLIKIDVEGAELDVLESARPIIAGNPSIALIVEFGFSHLARTGHTTKDWLAAFHDLGLVHRAINVDTGHLEEWTDDQLEGADSVNLFFAHRDSVAWAKAGVVT